MEHDGESVGWNDGDGAGEMKVVLKVIIKIVEWWWWWWQ